MADQPAALRLAQRLCGLVRTVKVGSVLFTAAGPTVIRRLRRLGLSVMLDLKFFDIPSTVELSCQAAARLRVALLTVHAMGGVEMLRAAVAGAHHGARAVDGHPPAVLAVTILTSRGTGSARATTARVLGLAEDALHAGVDGVVASAQEAAALRRRFGQRLRIMCPGIRPAWAGADDQRRIVTPRQAVANGADWLVIGRPITAARNPHEAARRILTELEGSGC